ncbi:MAG: hypothetical protein BWK78_04055 [Thiotrichaceae bacterium IS1]|nr:MAG: hypothetical protein BWK78_04055 [Thiotrichaceae bacterium IS1]
MKLQAIMDTGPLVAALSEADKYHTWVIQPLATFQPPLLTSEAVLSETCFLLWKRRATLPIAVLFCWLNQGTIALPFHLHSETAVIGQWMKNYANVPMSLADAGLVRMSEQYPNQVILTLDGDFHIYRKPGRQIIPVIMP